MDGTSASKGAWPHIHHFAFALLRCIVLPSVSALHSLCASCSPNSSLRVQRTISAYTAWPCFSSTKSIIVHVSSDPESSSVHHVRPLFCWSMSSGISSRTFKFGAANHLSSTSLVFGLWTLCFE